MTSKKILIISIVVSLVSHVFMLSLAGLVDMRGNTIKEEVLTISLKDPPPTPDKKQGEKQEEKPLPRHEENTDYHKAKHDETVELASLDTKYVPYLQKIKKKIETIWIYPQSALEREEEGTTVIKFSLSKSGSLTANDIISSSGSQFLDEGALDVIRSAAPYDPFPREFDLAQLNIIARFQYKLVEQ